MVRKPLTWFDFIWVNRPVKYDDLQKRTHGPLHNTSIYFVIHRRDKHEFFSACFYLSLPHEEMNLFEWWLSPILCVLDPETAGKWIIDGEIRNWCVSFGQLGNSICYRVWTKKQTWVTATKYQRGGLTSAVKRVRLGLNKMCMKRRKKVCRKVLKSDNMTQVKRNWGERIPRKIGQLQVEQIHDTSV